jgi:hypothetical protein
VQQRMQQVLVHLASIHCTLVPQETSERCNAHTVRQARRKQGSYRRLPSPGIHAGWDVLLDVWLGAAKIPRCSLLLSEASVRTALLLVAGYWRQLWGCALRRLSIAAAGVFMLLRPFHMSRSRGQQVARLDSLISCCKHDMMHLRYTCVSAAIETRNGAMVGGPGSHRRCAAP